MYGIFSVAHSFLEEMAARQNTGRVQPSVPSLQNTPPPMFPTPLVAPAPSRGVPALRSGPRCAQRRSAPGPESSRYPTPYIPSRESRARTCALESLPFPRLSPVTARPRRQAQADGRRVLNLQKYATPLIFPHPFSIGAGAGDEQGHGSLLYGLTRSRHGPG